MSWMPTLLGQQHSASPFGGMRIRLHIKNTCRVWILELLPAVRKRKGHAAYASNSLLRLEGRTFYAAYDSAAFTRLTVAEMRSSETFENRTGCSHLCDNSV